MEKVQANLDALERKLTKANKIAAKGEKMKVGDAIKLGRKSQSMASVINKGMREYDVRLLPTLDDLLWPLSRTTDTQTLTGH